MLKLPKEGDSKKIGRLASRSIGVQMPLDWIAIPTDGDSDFGIDYFIQLKNSNDYVEFSFYLQLKGTKSPVYNALKTFISHDFQTSTLELYRRQDPLVMVVVVDIIDERKLHECPIYYFWLDDEWFRQNADKLKNQKTISIQIPISNILNQDLDIYDFYATRFKERLAFSELRKGISDQEKPILETLGSITKTINEKPIFLKIIEEKGEAPWIDNPKGETATDLKAFSDLLSNNRINDARQLLDRLEAQKNTFSTHELAEFYYQRARLLSCQGSYREAKHHFKLAQDIEHKDRYQLAYLESKFNFESVPSKEEFEELINTLQNDNFTKCAIKAKALAILKRPNEALELLRQNYPDEITTQMVICSIGELYDDLDKIIEQNIDCDFNDERKKFIFNGLAARRYFHKFSHNEKMYEEILPVDGKPDYDVEGMKLTYRFIQKAWDSAKNLGYPSDVTMLMDTSSLIYGYFNKLEELCPHIDAILAERPNHIEIIRTYTRVLFNIGEYQKTINFLNRIENKDSDESGMEILSYHYLGEDKQCLDLIKYYEDTLLHFPKENTPAIFCIGVEIADLMFQKDLVEKYKDIIRKFPDGEAFIAIQKFITRSNADQSQRSEYAQDLYQIYLKLDKPLVIAEQLISYLDPRKSKTAQQIVELAEQILNVRELRRNKYLDLAQAFFTIARWEDAEQLAEKNIVKGIDISKWKLVQAVALQNQGKVGRAYKVIKEVIKQDNTDKIQQQFYINLCFALGFTDEVIDILENNLTKNLKKNDKIHLIRRLITIYINKPNYIIQLKSAIISYGELIDKNNSQQEGDYLQLCMFHPPFENEEQFAVLRSRSNKYFEQFPDSQVLKRGNINIADEPESLLDSLRQLTGITTEQVKQSENNKLKLRSREMPIPFFMRGDFLQDTKDIFMTWILSKTSPVEYLEFKIVHSPQLEAKKFADLINGALIVLDETSLLTLNDLNLLEIFLKTIPNFSILTSLFQEINIATNGPMPIYSYLSGSILNAIQNNIEKLNFLDVGEDSKFSYGSALKEKNGILITDDLYLSNLISVENPAIFTGNIFNILEYLYNIEVLTKDTFYNKISAFFDLGIIDISIRFNTLSNLLDYYLGESDIIDYKDTGFEQIFDRIIAMYPSFEQKYKIFLDMFYCVNIYNLSPQALLSLINKLLEYNPAYDPDKVITTWLLYSGLQREIVINPNTLVSQVHSIIWSKYKNVMQILNPNNYSFEFLIQKTITVVCTLEVHVRKAAFHNLKSSFSPYSVEYRSLQTLDKIFY